MAHAMASMMLLAIFGFSTRFYQQFYYPKLLVLLAMAALCLAWLWRRPQLHLPGASVLRFIAIFLAATALSGLSSGAPLAGLTQWAFYVSACLLYATFLQFGRAEFDRMLQVLFAAALVQLPLMAAQQLGLHALPAALIGQHERLYGTLGNQEFLAALLGVAFFTGLHFRAQASDGRHRMLLAVACGALLLGLVLAHNKGALLFIGLYFLWRRYPSYGLLLGLGGVALIAGVLLFPDSLNGRALLWLAAVAMYAQHPLTGVGLLQFENAYLDVVRGLFSAHPALAAGLGGHTAMTLDAHNLFLQFGAELGSGGLLLALLLLRHGWRAARAAQGYLGAALLFLLFKCLYTVVLPSVTGMIMFVLLLAGLTQTRGVAMAGVRRYTVAAAVPVIAAVLMSAAVPLLSDHYYQQGARALFTGANTQAADFLERAVFLNAENADASLALAQASYLQHDYTGMHAHIQNALRYRRNKDTYKIAASMYYYARRYDEAFTLYHALHQAFPLHLTSLTKLAAIYMIRGDFDEAYVMAQRALHTEPREEAASDAKNLAIARQIVKDSYPRLSPAFKSNTMGEQ